MMLPELSNHVVGFISDETWISLSTNEENKWFIIGNVDHLSIDVLRSLFKYAWAMPIVDKRMSILNVYIGELTFYEHALPVLSKYVDLIDDEGWFQLCQQPWGRRLVSTNADKLDEMSWIMLCYEEEALYVLMDNIDRMTKACWHVLCKHEWALPLMEMGIDELDALSWRTLCYFEWARMFALEHADIVASSTGITLV